MTALGYATSEGHSAVVRLLLQAGASVDLRDCCGRTLLGYAASEGQHSDETLSQLRTISHKGSRTKTCSFCSLAVPQ